MNQLKYNGNNGISKRHECLTNVFNSFRVDWETIVGVVGSYPISNPREACKIAEKYIGMEETECQCIISAHVISKEDVKGIKVYR